MRCSPQRGWLMPPDRVKLKVGRLSKWSLRRNDKLDRSCREPTNSVVRDCIAIREESWQHFPFSVLLPRVLSRGEGAPYDGQCCPDRLTPIRQSGRAWLTSTVQAHTEKAPLTRNVPAKKQHSLELALSGHLSGPSCPLRAKKVRRRSYGSVESSPTAGCNLVMPRSECANLAMELDST